MPINSLLLETALAQILSGWQVQSSSAEQSGEDWKMILTVRVPADSSTEEIIGKLSENIAELVREGVVLGSKGIPTEPDDLTAAFPVLRKESEGEIAERAAAEALDPPLKETEGD